jgi:hydrogenase/urease accessory protein HupE
MRRAIAILGLLLWITEIRAHPVAQGAIELALSEKKIEIRVRVSPEEVFDANLFARQSAESLSIAYQEHGDYLLKHLRLFCDGRELSGKRIGFVAPQPGTAAARAVYSFEFPVTAWPRSILLEENVLNEFNYAPGNRWEATYLVRVRAGAKTILEGALLSSKAPLTFFPASPPSSWRLAADYVRHGVRHILTGYDHLLFIGALALAVTSFWMLFNVIAVFTLAHTITLTLAVLNLVRMPPKIVEPMIALSIVVVALQNVCWPHRGCGRALLIVAFFFGLFHGLGFAGGLLETMTGLPGLSVALAIIAFSVGVEIGHQCVVLPLFGLTRWVRSRPGRSREVAPIYSAEEVLFRGGSAIICLFGLFYLVAALNQLRRF